MTREEMTLLGVAFCKGFKDGINTIDERVMQSAKDKAESEAYELFGSLQQLTQEEKEAKMKSLSTISKPTGRKFSDFYAVVES